VSLATEGQTKEKLTELLYTVLGQYGCHGCGRLIKVDMTFAADPGPELSKQGATSISHG
jgi:hypothetical protein